MSAGGGSARLRALLLVLPLVAFLGLFFVWPLWTMIEVSIHNEAIGDALPLTTEAIGDWNGDGLPAPAVRAALLQDLRTADTVTLGAAVRRLNSATPGFRSLMGRTERAARAGPQGGAVDLVAVDQRWGEERFWRAIKRGASPYTDRNLLAAVDMRRNENGRVESLPPGQSANRLILWRTFEISGVITLLCLAIGLPYALLAASVAGWKRNLLLIAVLLPLWTSLLVRTAAWYILLQNQGLINEALMRLGLIDQPLPLIFNRIGVVIAMTHVLLPFMVLPIFGVVTAIPGNLMPAAASLGAPPLRAFWRVLLPLSLPGVLAGSLLVFMVAIGYYITPALVGGPDDQMISSIIAFYALGTANWGMAGALGLILLVITTILYAVYGRFSRGGSPMGA